MTKKMLGSHRQPEVPLPCRPKLHNGFMLQLTFEALFLYLCFYSWFTLAGFPADHLKEDKGNNDFLLNMSIHEVQLEENNTCNVVVFFL